MLEVWMVPVAIVVLCLSSIKILREYERGVIFRLGRVQSQPLPLPIDMMSSTGCVLENPAGGPKPA